MKNRFLSMFILLVVMLVAGQAMATLGLSLATRNAMATSIRDQIDSGSSAGRLQICSNARPSTCASTCTVLVTFTLPDPSGTVSSGTLTFNSISSQTAGATATALWYRVDAMSGGTPTCVYDGQVTATGGGGDLQLNTTSIVTGATVTITGNGTITMPNS
jgi:hypothetical protein